MSAIVFRGKIILIFLFATAFTVNIFSKASFIYNLSDPFADQVLYFKVVKKGYTLDFNWATSPNADAIEFTVESSKSAEVWEPLRKVIVDRQSTTRYSLNGLTPKWSTAYYRLKVTDSKGEFFYTKPIKISMYYRDLDNVMVYPNPLVSNAPVKLKFNRPILNGSKISVYSINGKHQFDQVINETTETIELPPLDAGNYLIEIIGASDVSRVKVVVK